MCSSDRQCFGYTSVDRTASVDGSSGTCAMIVDDSHKTYEWYDSTSQNFALYLNKVERDMTLISVFFLCITRKRSYV